MQTFTDGGKDIYTFAAATKCRPTLVGSSISTYRHHEHCEGRLSTESGISGTGIRAGALAFCCLILAPVCAVAATPAIAYVQGNYATPQSPEKSVAVKYKAAQLAGDLNVVVVGWNDSSAKVNTVTDSAGNIYSLALGPTIVSGKLSQSIYIAKNIAAAGKGANTVTISFSASAAYADIRILEYSGADPANPVDAAAGNSGNSTSSNASATTTNPSDLLFAANIVQSMTSGPGSGFTKRLLTSPDADIAEDTMATTAGGFTATAPVSPAEPWVMQMVAIRTPSGSGGSAPTPSALSCANSSMTGSGTDACTVTLNAKAANGGLTVSLSSNNSAVTVPASVTVPAGSTSTGFSASVSAVSKSQTATLTASANGVAQTFTLQLGGAVATLSINATNIAFGDVNDNTTSTQPLTMTSTGTAPVTVSSANINGSEFAFSGVSFPLTLNPNQSATMSVEFDPTTAGSASGQLAINSNSSTNPNATVGLTGTGQAASYSVSITWDAPVNSSDPVAGYNVYRSPSGASAYQLLNSTADSQTAYTDNTVQSGQTYDYIVESVDASGVESMPSNTATVSVP